MKEYPDFVFTCSSSAFYALLELVEPEMLQEIGARVAEGRWELVGGWWVEPDVNVPCGESLMRQGLYGQRYLLQKFGRHATVGYNPDTFGHPETLPQILDLQGLSGYVFMRPATHEKNLPGHVFRWRSPDGSEILTARIARSYATWGKELTEHLQACVAEAPTGIRDYIVFYGVGDHGGGPTRENIESLHGMGAVGDFEVRLSSLGAFFDSVRRDMDQGAEVPTVADELQHHARGCYTAHSGIKRGNRRVENLLMAAERMAAMASWSTGFAYPADELREAWKALLFTQFHDILAGTSLPAAYTDARDAHGYAAHIASRTLYAAAQSMARHTDTAGDGDALMIFNTLPWPVRVPVEVERGGLGLRNENGKAVPVQSTQPTTVAGQRRACFVTDLPPLGFRVFREVAQTKEVPCGRSLRAGSRTLENDWWKLDLDADTGLARSLYGKAAGLEFLGSRAMSLKVMKDESDTWSHGVPAFRQEAGEFRAAAAPVLEESGPVRACLRTHLRWHNSEATHRIRLYRDIPLIEGEIRLLWRERHAMLKLCMPTAMREGTAVCEVPYGAIERPQDGNEQPCQAWACIAGKVVAPRGDSVACGLALVNDGQYGYDALDGELRLSLLRSPVYAHHDPATLDPSLEYAYMDQGEHTFRYALVPFVGRWQEAELPRRAVEFNVQPLWVHEYDHAGKLQSGYSFLSVEPANIVALVCKQAEDGDGLIIRAVEAAGSELPARFEMPSLGLIWYAHPRPWQIVSFRVPTGPDPRVVLVNGLEEEV